MGLGSTAWIRNLLDSHVLATLILTSKEQTENVQISPFLSPLSQPWT